MKTNISPELKQAIADSIERSKAIVIKPFTPYVSKPNPTPAYQNMDRFKNGLKALGRSLTNGR
jgi:hypothetical protein